MRNCDLLAGAVALVGLDVKKKHSRVIFNSKIILFNIIWNNLSLDREMVMPVYFISLLLA